MPHELWIVGYPSFVGGADTELDHQIDLWTEFKWEIHLCPVDGFSPENHDPKMVDSVKERGCIVHQFDVDKFKDKVILAMCNDGLLKQLSNIHIAGKPKAVIWANCMTWPMDAEKMCHRLGLIDYYIFQSHYQKQRLMAELTPVNSDVTVFDKYIPWFNHSRFPMKHKEPANYFGVGRVSRDDPAKFHPATWKMYGQITAPLPVKTFILGFGENSQKSLGLPEKSCIWLDYLTWGMGGISITEFYSKIHVMVHLTGGSRENWPRCVMEAWANGVVPIVDNDFGCTEMIENGLDGFLVNSPEEASFKTSVLAWDNDLRREMVEAGFKTLKEKHSDKTRAIAGWNELMETIHENKESQKRDTSNTHMDI